MKLFQMRFFIAIGLVIGCNFHLACAQREQDTKAFTAFLCKTYNDAHVSDQLPAEQPAGKTSFIASMDPRYKDADIPRIEKRLVSETAFRFVGEEYYNPSVAGNNQQLSPGTIKKMELFAGGEKSECSYINSLFSHMYTHSGIAWAAHQLSNPITDIDLLHKRQRIISFLAEKPELLQSVMHVFDTMHGEEELLFFGGEGTLTAAVQALFYFPGVFDRLNKTELSFELQRGLELFSATAMPIILPSTLAMVVWNLTRGQYTSTADALKQFPGNIKTSIKDGVRLFLGATLPTKLRVSYAAGILGLSTAMSVSKIKLEVLIVKELQKILIGVARYLDAVRELAKLVKAIEQEYPDVYEYLPSLKHFVDLDDISKHSDDFNYVISALHSNTFKGKESAFSRIGRILKVYKLLPSVMHEFKPILAAVGELDCYVALIKKIDESSKNAFCSAQFVASGPTLYAKSFWNPFVLYHKPAVVMNDFDLLHDSMHNVIITGPNTGGKSTILKGLFLNVLLSQTFGYAAAESFTISPFSLLNCYLNITDDLAEGVSLFKAEVLRAKELLNNIKSLGADQYAFTIMDEVFSGTSPKEGEEAACCYTELLNTFKNSSCIVATHYPKMVTLAGYKNMHVEVIRNTDNSLTYTYLLKDGPSYMNIAMDLLMQEGVL